MGDRGVTLTFKELAAVLAAVFILATCIGPEGAPAAQAAPDHSPLYASLLVKCLNGGRFMVESTIVMCLTTEVRP
jgi:hypothetical protein